MSRTAEDMTARAREIGGLSARMPPDALTVYQLGGWLALRPYLEALGPGTVAWVCPTCDGSADADRCGEMTARERIREGAQPAETRRMTSCPPCGTTGVVAMYGGPLKPST